MVYDIEYDTIGRTLGLSRPLCLILWKVRWPDPVLTEKHCCEGWSDVWMHRTPFQEPHPRSIMIGRATYIVQDTTCSMLILLLLCVTVPSHHHYHFPPKLGVPTRRFWQFRCFVLYIVHCTNIFCSVICASHMKRGSASCISEVHTDERNTYSQPPDSGAGWQANEEDCFQFL